MLLSPILSLVSLALRVGSYALLAYCIMSFVMPDHSLYHTLGRYVRPVLDPVRRKLWQFFPRLRTLPIDISPMALWLIIDLLAGLVNSLRRIL